MRTLDRYVAWQYFASLVSCTLMLIVLYMVIDFFSKMDDFWAVDNTMAFLVRYYAFRIPQFIMHLAPVITLIAAVLVLVRLVRQNELVPMVTSGTSVLRIMLPMLVMAAGVSGIMVAVDEYVLPRLDDPLQDSSSTLGRKETRDNVIVRDDRGNVLVVRHYYPGERRLENLVLMQTGEAGGLIQKVDARSARWTDGDGGGWVASDGTEIVFDREGKRMAQRTFGEDGRRLVIAIVPADLLRTRSGTGFQTFAELSEAVRANPFEANLKVRLHEKLTFPTFTLILMGLGIPFVLRRDVRNLFVGGGICLVVCGIFFSAYFFCSDLGSKGEIDPVLAAWLPVVIFGGVAIFLSDTIPT